MNMTRTMGTRRGLSVFCAFTASLSAMAADYHWTGAAGNRLWSDPGNWETAAGAAVDSVDCANAHTYNFGARNGTNVGWENGLVVTQDVSVVIGSAMAFNPANNDLITLEIVSAPGSKMSMTAGTTTIYCQKNSEVTLTVDMSGDNTTGTINKTNEGRLVWNLKAANTGVRTLVVNSGTIGFGGVAAPNFNVRMNTATSVGATAARLVNELDGAVLHGLAVAALDSGANSIGRVDLKSHVLKVGGNSDTASTNLMPMAMFGEGGTLVLQNERRALLRGLPMGGTLAVDRADAHVVAPSTAIRWLFDDASDPTRDVVGSGCRMLAPNGMPDVVQDETRGGVLSISGGRYFRGPDEDGGLDGLQLQSARNPYTVAFWFKPDANCDSKGKLFFWGVVEDDQKQNVNGRSAGLRLNDNAASGLLFTIWGTNKEIATPASPRDGNWHHFAAVYDGLGTFNLYYDGALALTFAYDAAAYDPPNRNFCIGSVYGTGAWSAIGANPYTGLLDDFLIGAYALNAEEIAAVKENGLVSAIPAGSIEARSAGEVAFATSSISAKTLSGHALAGGVTMLADGSTLTVGAEAGAAETEFKGTLSGGGTTLVKEGADYALTLSGPAAAVTNVVVKEGTLAVTRSLARAGLARAGLAAHYAFEDAEEWGADSSPSSFTLTKSGSGTVSQIDDSVSGKALNFGGSSYLKSSDNLPATFSTGNGSYTVSMWIRPTETAYKGNAPIYCWGKDGTDNKTSFMRLNGKDSGSGVMFTHWGNNFEANAGNLADGMWHHVVAVYNGVTRTKTVYVDGKAYSQAPLSFNAGIDGATCLYIGSRSGSTSTTYSGDMDEFMVFNYAWSADQVTSEYESKGKTPAVLPSPVAHWTFDDDEAPGADSAANALDLAVSGTVALESGDAVCGKAARISASSGYFRLDSFPAQIPSGTAPYTVVVRYRPDADQASSYYSSIVMWGDTSGWSSGNLFKFGTDHGDNALRVNINGSILYGEDLCMTSMGTDRSRWVTAAFVSAPQYDGTDKRRTLVYVDGELMSSTDDRPSALTAKEFSIGSNYTGTQNFHGLVDDVQIYDNALSAEQIRLVSERLEAAKGVPSASTASVFTANPVVTVADGATLKVESAERVAALSGEGTIEVVGKGTVTADRFDEFFGAVTGDGAFGIADNAVIEFGDGARPVIDAAGGVSLGANVTVNIAAKAGDRDLVRAASLVGTENLAGWRAIRPNGRVAPFTFVVDGSKVRMKWTPAGTVIIFR